MNSKILVAYASKYGATKEIAEKIQTVLTDHGLPSEVTPAAGDLDPSSYNAVILGSAIYIGKWQSDATKFLNCNKKVLSNKLVWLFASGPSGEEDPMEHTEIEWIPRNLQRTIENIHPREVKIFLRNITPEKINPIEKWAVKSLVKNPLGDFRNWKAIADWGKGIALVLKNDGFCKD